ncbi:MAG: Gfo/Idh/MocA family oxidoreductase [Propionibacteriaceae bacterium]|jgi:predicted dehydrogenase|nr:Gfo/Idh/MocA family oxidoreductase [Propionibacteriaceae bacterium]
MSSEIVRFGVLGASAIAQDKVLPALLKAGNARADLLGTRSPAARSEVAERFQISRGAVTMDEAIADDQLDAIYVSLPNSLHAEWIIKALQAGKPVLSDKPLTVSGAEAERVAEVSRATGLPVMEGYMYRFHPQHRYIRQRIADGSIGTVREARAFFLFHMLQAVSATDIRVVDGPGAGALMDMGCYTISAVRMVMGGEPISATGWRVRNSNGLDVGGVANLLFPEERRAQVSWGWDTGNGGNLQVIGTKAILETGNPFVPDQGNPGETVVTELAGQGRLIEHRFDTVDQFQLEFEEFAGAIIEGREPMWTVDDAVQQAKAMDLVRALPALDELARS